MRQDSTRRRRLLGETSRLLLATLALVLVAVAGVLVSPPRASGVPSMTDSIAPAEPMTQQPTPAPEPTQEAPSPEPAPEETPTPQEQPTPEETPTPEEQPTPEPVQTTAAPSVNQSLSQCEERKSPLTEDTPTIVSQVGLEKAWEVSQGKDVVVAVVDSGVDASNPHLEGAVIPGTDLMSGGDGTVDEDGHGTAVAGLVASRAVEGSGLVGIAQESAIMPVRVYAGTSDAIVEEGRGPQAALTAAGIVWAADNGAKVIVVALSLAEDVPELGEAVEHANQAGALVVASGGNEESAQGTAEGGSQATSPAAGGSGSDSGSSSDGGSSNGEGGEAEGDVGQEDPAQQGLRYPAAYPSALGVTALDASGAVSDAVVHGAHVELAVPAQSVLTTFMADGDCVVAQDSPSASFATGYAAGVAALVVAAYPQESPAEWKYRMTVTALRSTPAEASPAVGWGVVAPYAALDFVNDGTALGPENPRGARPAVTPAVSWATPPVVDPGPARRARLARGAGAAGAVVLAVALVASRARTRSVWRRQHGGG